MIIVKHCLLNSDNNISCRNAVVDRESERVYCISVSNEYELYIFETRVNTRVICSGCEYQTYVWGETRYDSWLLRMGLNKCIVLDSVYINSISEDTYVVSKNPSPRQLSRDISIILKYLKTMNSRGEIVFMIDEDIGIELFFENIVSGRDTNQLLKHIYNLLLGKVKHRGEADAFLELIEKQLISNY